MTEFANLRARSLSAGAPPPPAAFRRLWKVAGLSDRSKDWNPLSGGRSNHCWRVAAERGDCVVKLYDLRSASVTFPNDPDAEWSAIVALYETGLAPEPVHRICTGAVRAIAYRHVPGPTWQQGAADVAQLLGRIHRSTIPNLPKRGPNGSRQIRGEIDALLRLVPIALASEIRGSLPDEEVSSCALLSVLHGDPVAGNIIQAAHGLCLIDWQCPGWGDPATDIATFLSPGMQIRYHRTPLSPAQRADFLNAYPDYRVVSRYLRLAPWLHARLAAYCASRGGAGNLAAARLELADVRQPHRL